MKAPSYTCLKHTLKWKGHLVYKNKDGETKVLIFTLPEIESLNAAPIIWLKKGEDAIEQAKIQVHGIAATIINLGICHYWRIKNYDHNAIKSPFKEPTELQDINFLILVRKTDVLRAYMEYIAPMAHEVWECNPTLPIECSEGDNWYSYLYACECEAMQEFMQSELYQDLTPQQRQMIYGYTSLFISFLAKYYPVSTRTQYKIKQALERNMQPIQLQIETKTTIIRKKEFCKKLSSFLVPQSDPFIDDDDIQTHLENAAKGGATDLANYLSSEEGKKHFDFRNMTRSQVLAILNKECGTDIKDDTFYRACRICGLVFTNSAMQGPPD